MPALKKIRKVTYSPETKKAPSYAYNPISGRSVRRFCWCPNPPTILCPQYSILDGGTPLAVGLPFDGGTPLNSGVCIYDGGNP